MLHDYDKIKCTNMTAIRWENRTSHPIDVLNTNGDVVHHLPASRYAIRVKPTFRVLYTVDDITVGQYYGKPEFKNLPLPFREDTIYIVSGLAEQLIRRWNVVAPRTDGAGCTRDPNGGIKATRMFLTHGRLVT